MHALKCPQCGRVLAVKAPVVNSSVRCRGCGAIFTGSSSEMRKAGGEALAPGDLAAMPEVTMSDLTAPAGASTAPGRRRRSSPWLAIVVVLGIMGCGAVAAVLVIKLMQEHPQGGPVVSQKPKVAQAATRFVDRSSEDEVLVPSKADGAAPEMFPKAHAAGTQPSKDATVTFTCNRDATAIVNQGVVIGVIKNNSPNVLGEVTLVGINGSEAVVTIQPPCRNLPPGASVPFSANYTCPNAKEIESMVVSEAVEAAPTVVAWEVPDAKVQPDANSNRVVVTGKTTNAKAGAVKGPIIHCCFFNANGELAGEAEGKLQAPCNDSLPAGQTATFTLEWETPQKHLQPKPYVTLVGQVEP